MTDILSIVIGSGTTAAVIGAIGKAVLEYSLKVRFQALEKEFQRQHAIELEGLKVEWARLKVEHEKKFSRIYDTRFEVVSKLHREFRELADYLQSTLSKEDPIRMAAARDKCYAAYKSVLDASIYLPESFVSKCATTLGEASANAGYALNGDRIKLLWDSVGKINFELTAHIRRIIGVSVCD